MANATIGITMEGRRVDLSGEIPNDVAESIVRSITTLLIEPTPAAPAEPETSAVPERSAPPND